MTGIAVTTWAANGQDRIDLFWRDKDLQIAHIDSNADGHGWSSNRIGPLGSVIPDWPDALGGRPLGTVGECRRILVPTLSSPNRNVPAW
jgi:hypothetical protein